MNRDTGSMMSDIVYSNPPPAKFRIVSGPSDLLPTVNEQPKFRRANPDGGFISPLSALTMHLATTYRLCNDKFTYESSRNPRRCLTKPGKGLKNEGFDNEDSDYILYVNDVLGIDQGHKYVSSEFSNEISYFGHPRSRDICTSGEMSKHEDDGSRGGKSG
jgi:dual specificity protein kinase YAK1